MRPTTRHGRLTLALALASILAGWGLWEAAEAQAQAQKPAAPKPADKPADADDGDGVDAEEAKDKAIADRFRKVLEASPRRGTALDRLYGYHVERGTLDKLVAEFAERAKKNAKDGTAWMMVALIESQRGRDAAAVAAFKGAEAALPDNPIPAYYLGLSLVLVGQPDAAAESFERALTRKPNRNDQLDIFQALGRVYQRSQRPEKALEVWNRLEKLYPDDARVQEQIATTLIEEGQYEQALPRLERLAAKTDDKYRQATLRMDAADLKVKLKKAPEALADLEKVLNELNPESWLYRDVRRRIEDVYLRNDDLAGLANYYAKWLEKNASDVDAMARLAKNLSAQGRVAEAKTWLEKGLAAAPSNKGLRQALIEQFVFAQDYAGAVAQYEGMNKADPNNPDILRDWGKMVLRDTAKPEPERKAAAAAIWRRLLDKKPTDPVMTSQVADLLRGATIPEEAIALYKKAIALAPDAPQYREYLGEYFHSLKRPEEALATWRPIAEGANRNSKNLARLAEVFAGFGYKKEAVGAMAEAVTLERDDFTMLTTYADMLFQDSQFDPALAQLAAARKFATNPEEVEQLLVAEIKVYQAEEKLADKIDELAAQLDKGENATGERYLRLSRYYEANRQPDKATQTIRKATERDPKSVPTLVAASRIHEAGGDLLAAVDANRRLAALDRRNRTDYLTQVAKLEQRLGRRDQALQAGRDLLAASPGNPEVYKFYADLCFQLGESEDGLEALRRSVRANPTDPQGLITLANALAERVRSGEAVELLWRAFEKTTELEAKFGVIERLTQLYLETNQFDKMMERLERERREADKTREMTLCIAAAHQAAGDLGSARQQLERLLTENTRDTSLLGQLSTLSEQESDFPAALKYQRQLAAVAPGVFENQVRLAQILLKAGEADEAAEVWVKMVATETEPHKNLQSIDQLITSTKYDPASAILSRMLAQKPGNWELLYREGAILAARDKPAEAAARFQAILALKLPDDEAGEGLQNQQKQFLKKVDADTKKGPGKKPVPKAPSLVRGRPVADPSLTAPLERRLRHIYDIRRVSGIDRYDYRSNGGQATPFYAPEDFGEARMAALAWLYEFSKTGDASETFLKERRVAKDQAAADLRPAWDWFYLQSVRYENKDLFATSLKLAQGDDPAGLLALVRSSAERVEQGRTRYRRGRRADDDDDKKKTPLPPEQLAKLVGSYEKLKQVKPAWVSSETAEMVLRELKTAGKAEQEQALYARMRDEANTTDKIASALAVAADRDDYEAMKALFARLDRLQGQPKSAAAAQALPTRHTGASWDTLMGKRAEAKKYADVRQICDDFLAPIRRQNLAAPKTASAAAGRRSSSGQPISLQYPNLKALPAQLQNVQLKFPTVNDYYGTEAVDVLYLNFLLHKEGDLLSDLFAHTQKQLETVPAAEKVYLHLALGYLHWWADEKEESLEQLALATQAAPDDFDMVMTVALLREQNGEKVEALALLDSITPADTQVMQQREEAALRLSTQTGNIERAQTAANRLFGLRLDSEKQLELAGTMHRLGMHELAETVLARAQRQAGNKTNTLLRLMSQYQSQNQVDLAVQTARQILRKTPVTAQGQGQQSGRGRSDEASSARAQAIGVLTRSGQLKDLVERGEAQIKASPRSLAMHQGMLTIYEAAGDKPKQKATLLKIVELKPDDARLRFQTAEQLVRLKEPDEAMAQYKVAIKKEPALFGDNYYEVQRLFSERGKFEELIQLLEEVDFRKVPNYWSLMDIVSPLLEDAKSRDMGLRLFKKLWGVFPEHRGQMIGNLYREEVWQLPEIYDYVKQAVIPKELGDDPWSAATNTVNSSNDGAQKTVVNQLLSMARAQHRMPELRAEVAAFLAANPTWHLGRGLLAVIDIQTGKKEEGKKAWAELFADPKAEVPATARFSLALELEFYSGLEELAIKTLEDGFDEALKDEDGGGYNQGSLRRLVWWYEQNGRPEDARQALLRIVKATKLDNTYYGGGYGQYRVVQSKFEMAGELARMGFAVDAVRLCNELLQDRDSLAAANQYGGERFDRQVEALLQNSVRQLKPESLGAAVEALLTPLAGKDGAKADARHGVLDLVIVIDSQNFAKAKLVSVFALALDAAKERPEVRKIAVDRLAELVKKYPDDFAVLTAAALVDLGGDDKAAAKASVERLVKLTERVPLEAAKNGKTNSRQRTEASRQIPVWLVARACLKSKEHKAAGEVLAARAAEAARRQSAPAQAATIYREWGQLALDAGDKAKAEALWAEVVAVMVPKPLPKPEAKAAPAPAPPTPAPAPAAAPAKPPADVVDEDGVPVSDARLDPDATFFVLAPQAVPFAVPLTPGAAPAAASAPRAGAPITTEQFFQIQKLALIASDNGLTQLSVRSMMDALRAGPPVATNDRDRNRGGGGYTVKIVNGVQYLVSGEDKTRSVDEAVKVVVQRWADAGVPLADRYRLVARTILPESRPAEVFLSSDVQQVGRFYVMSSNGRGWTPIASIPGEGDHDPRGLDAILIDSAVEAGQVADLRARCESRLKQPLGELDARLLLFKLALRTKDDALALAGVAAIGEKLQRGTEAKTAKTATDLATLALARPALADAAVPVLEKVAANHVVANNVGEAVAARGLLVRHFLDANKPDLAKAQLKKIEEAAKRSGDNDRLQAQLGDLYLAAGMPAEALAALGGSVDTQTLPGADQARKARRSEATLTAFPALARSLATLPPPARYDLLKTWTMPTEARKTLRYAVGTFPDRAVPREFDPRPPLADLGEYGSTLYMLVQAAKEAGKLDELAAAADKCVADKVEFAETLAQLVGLTQGGAKADAAVKAFAAATRARIEDAGDDEGIRSRYDYEGQRSPPAHPSEILFARLCLANPAYRPMLEQLLPALSRNTGMSGEGDAAPRVKRLQESLTLAKYGTPDALASPLPPRWAQTSPRARWLAHDGVLTATQSTEPSLALFDVPLAGTYTFTVECDLYGGAAGAGGIVYEGRPVGGGMARVYPVLNDAGAFTVKLPDAPKPGEPKPEDAGTGTAKYTFEVSPGKVRCLLNGRLFYEDADPAPTAPFLALVGGRGYGHVYRNPTLAGKPEVMAKVPLLAGDYLEGWGSPLFGNSLPSRIVQKEALKPPKPRAKAAVPEADPDDEGPEVVAQAKTFDWAAKGGELVGRRVSLASGSAANGHLAYYRPLGVGDAVAYEFYSEAGVAHADPCLGRVVYRIAPDGLKLRYLPEGGSDGGELKLPDLPAAGAGPVKLKDKAWNAVTLTRTAAGVELTLNGERLYTGPAVSGQAFDFGWHHDRSQVAARIRGAVLTGGWPKALGSLADVSLANPAPSATVARVRRTLVGEMVYAYDAKEVVEKSRGLPAAERYARLAAWVLPTESRPVFQLAGVTKSLDERSKPDKPGPGAPRTLRGSEFQSPALALVAAAKEAGKLDELAAAVSAFVTGGDPALERSKAAMFAAVASARGDAAQAKAALAALKAIGDAMPMELRVDDRWPDLFALHATVENPALAEPVAALLKPLIAGLNKAAAEKRPTDNVAWESDLRALAADAELRGRELKPFAHWASASSPVLYGSSGLRLPRWDYQGGVLTHHPGYGTDQLILKTPVRGDFEVACGLSLDDATEATIRYGNLSFALAQDRKTFVFHTGFDADRAVTKTISPPLADPKAKKVAYKLAVQKGVLTVSLDGRVLHTERVGAAPDPWLTVDCPADNRGTVANFALTGTPTVPKSVRLADGETLAAWHGGGGGYRNNGAWAKRGEELFQEGAKPVPNPNADPDEPENRDGAESAIYYHRPMLEDGTVEYEFYYDPDKAHVYPALDRLVLCPEPAGVRVHWMTGGDRAELAADNMADEPKNRRGKVELKPKAWNKAKLTVAGDTLKLAVNGVEVYERPIEPTNQRLFGLFHYTDRTQARVRAVVYTGNWAATPPPADKLFEVAK